MRLPKVDKQIRQLERKLLKLNRIDVPRAHSSALNKTMAKAKTQIVKTTAQKSQVQQKYVRKRVIVRRSTARTMKGNITGYTLPISLISMKAAEYKKGVKAGGKYYEGAFINRIKGKKQVLRRLGKARHPIVVMKKVIATPMANNIERIVQGKLNTDYLPTLRRDLNYRIAKYGNTQTTQGRN